MVENFKNSLKKVVVAIVQANSADPDQPDQGLHY